MKCRNPFQKGAALFPCGQCLPCRINKRREWLHRMILEEKCHPCSTFVTLTYSDQNLPMNSDGLPILNPKHLSDWLKRFRKTIAPLKVRYFAVGEYGDESWRPHYHLVLFGYSGCHHIQSRYSKFRTNCCPQCDTVRDTWGLGNVFLGTADADALQYTAGYTVKKMTHMEDDRLQGRPPEFARMSTKPGLGYNALWEVADVLMKFNLEERDDVPSALQHGKKILPLGRYLRQNLRLMVGKDAKAPESTIAKSQEEMYSVLADIEKETSFSHGTKMAVARLKAIENGDQQFRKLEAWQKIRKRKSSL